MSDFYTELYVYLFQATLQTDCDAITEATVESFALSDFEEM